MKSFYLLMLCTISLTFSGCTIIDGGSIITGTIRTPISVESVRIYRVAPDNYQEIALLSASAGQDFKSSSVLMNETIHRLKQEAAKVGANGVLLTGINERDAVRTSASYGTVNIYGNNGQYVNASGNNFIVNRGDSYTRMRGLAIYVP